MKKKINNLHWEYNKNKLPVNIEMYEIVIQHQHTHIVNILLLEGRDREAEAKNVIKQLEKKYAALQVVSVIKKLGHKTVSQSI